MQTQKNSKTLSRVGFFGFSIPIEKIGYGLGDTASNFVFHIVNAFLITYYTDVMGLNPVAVGTLYGVARIWDAISDPLMGGLADRTQT